jgi:S-adenosylmethionine/arginine decarboxylase-like enzyme|tara:strand:+ start:298 stop:747 length:450 start_codon:yes stop_codon:yes gene_type:complete
VKPLVHKHVIIRAEVLNPPTNENIASNQVQTLIDRIGMKVLMGPFARYVNMPGNRGLTVAAIIETSHIVLHSWDETDPAMIQLDVYTCGAFDPRTVFEWVEEYYNPVKMEYKYLDREHALTPASLPEKDRFRFSTQELVDATNVILQSS